MSKMVDKAKVKVRRHHSVHPLNMELLDRLDYAIKSNLAEAASVNGAIWDLVLHLKWLQHTKRPEPDITKKLMAINKIVEPLFEIWGSIRDRPLVALRSTIEELQREHSPRGSGASATAKRHRSAARLRSGK